MAHILPYSISVKGLIYQILQFPIFMYILGFFKELILSVMKTGPVPLHIGLIMDGNRRYAKQRELALKDGHTAGAESLMEVLDVSYKLGVECVTIYAFSIENFNRSKEEVDILFELLRDRLALLSSQEDSYAVVNKVQIRIVGNRSMIPEDILKDLEEIENRTKSETNKHTLNVCFPYTSRDDIAHSIQTVVEKYKSHEIPNKEEVTLQKLNENMYFQEDTPPLDILIRTSGHNRLSDFLLWQSNYACTIEFVDTLWPDFKFYNMVAVLLKWSYYAIMTQEEEKITGIHSRKSQKIVRNILKELPSPPPFASVSLR